MSARDGLSAQSREASAYGRRVAAAEHRLSQAVLVGWPALEQSLRAELHALLRAAPKGYAGRYAQAAETARQKRKN